MPRTNQPAEQDNQSLTLHLSGNGRDNQPLVLGNRKSTVGSHSNCTVVLNGASVQPLHCLVIQGNAGTVIRNFHADTRLNGHPLHDSWLEPGDQVSLGNVDLSWKSENAKSENSKLENGNPENEAETDVLRTPSASNSLDALKTEDRVEDVLALVERLTTMESVVGELRQANKSGRTRTRRMLKRLRHQVSESEKHLTEKLDQVAEMKQANLELTKELEELRNRSASSQDLDQLALDLQRQADELGRIAENKNQYLEEFARKNSELANEVQQLRDVAARDEITLQDAEQNSESEATAEEDNDESNLLADQALGLATGSIDTSLPDEEVISDAVAPSESFLDDQATGVVEREFETPEDIAQNEQPSEAVIPEQGNLVDPVEESSDQPQESLSSNLETPTLDVPESPASAVTNEDVSETNASVEDGESEMQDQQEDKPTAALTPSADAAAEPNPGKAGPDYSTMTLGQIKARISDGVSDPIELSQLRNRLTFLINSPPQSIAEPVESEPVLDNTDRFSEVSDEAVDPVDSQSADSDKNLESDVSLEFDENLEFEMNLVDPTEPDFVGRFQEEAFEGKENAAVPGEEITSEIEFDFESNDPNEVDAFSSFQETESESQKNEFVDDRGEQAGTEEVLTDGDPDASPSEVSGDRDSSNSNPYASAFGEASVLGDDSTLEEVEFNEETGVGNESVSEEEATSVADLVPDAGSDAFDALKSDKSDVELPVEDEPNEAASNGDDNATVDESTGLTTAHLYAQFAQDQAAEGDDSEVALPDPAPTGKSDASQEDSSDSENEDSYIHEYMQRLLGNSPATPEPEKEETDGAEPPSLLEKTFENELRARQEMLKPSEFVPKFSPPERNSNLQAMRDLANQSARSAIEVSTRRKRSEQMSTMVLIASGVCFFIGATLGMLAGSLLSVMTALSVIFFGLTGVGVWYYYGLKGSGNSSKEQGSAKESACTGTNTDPEKVELAATDDGDAVSEPTSK